MAIRIVTNRRHGPVLSQAHRVKITSRNANDSGTVFVGFRGLGDLSPTALQIFSGIQILIKQRIGGNPILKDMLKSTQPEFHPLGERNLVKVDDNLVF